MFDDEAGYDYTDPKHPTYGERMLGWADDARKREREDAPLLRHTAGGTFVVDRDPGDESDVAA